MNAAGDRLAAANSGSTNEVNGLYTYTYGVPSAGAWNAASKWLYAANAPWLALALADDGSRIYGGGSSAFPDNRYILVGSGAPSELV